MNIYLIAEDGDNFCIKAKTMAAAVSICELSYLEEREEEEGEKYNAEIEIKYFHEQILLSCSLIGDLRN